MGVLTAFSEKMIEGLRIAKAKKSFDKNGNLIKPDTFSSIPLNAKLLGETISYGDTIMTALIENGYISDNHNRATGKIFLTHPKQTKPSPVFAALTPLEAIHVMTKRGKHGANAYEILIQKCTAWTDGLENPAGEKVKEGIADFLALPIDVQKALFTSQDVPEDAKNVMIDVLGRAYPSQDSHDGIDINQHHPILSLLPQELKHAINHRYEIKPETSKRPL